MKPLGSSLILWWLSLCKVNFKHWVYFLLPLFVFPHCILCLMFEVSTFKRSNPMLNKWIWFVCVFACIFQYAKVLCDKKIFTVMEVLSVKVFERCMSALMRPFEFPPRIKGHLNYNNINQGSNKCSTLALLLLIEEFKLYCMLIPKLSIYLLNMCEVLSTFAWRTCWRNVRLRMFAFVP
jgi:hypothetical protein